MRAALRARLSGGRRVPQALGVLLLVAIVLPAVAQARAWVHPELTSARAAAGPGEELGIRVVLARGDLPPVGALRRQRIFERQGRVLASLPAARLRVRYRHRVLSGFSASVRPDVLEALARHPEVVSIHPDRLKRATLAQGGALVSAPQVHAAGSTGAGVRVAVLDTGIDTDHPDLVDDLVAEYCACDTSFLPFVGACCPNGLTRQTGPGSAEDGDGHGTSAAGIITSAHPTRRGVAPDAGVVAVKVLSDSGFGLDSGIDAGLDWVLDNRETYGIRVVNMSLGDGGEYASPNLSACSSDPTSIAIASLHAAGVAVFVASGNDGHDSGISAPACTAEAISVGGVYDAAVGSVSWCANESCTQTLCTDVSAPDGFVCHSNSGAILDILAPSFRTGTTGLGGGVDSDFGGTSASSAYAAAQAALLLEADPTLTPDGLRALLASSGPLVTNPDNGLSFPRSDAFAALVAHTCGNGVLDAHEVCDASAGSVCCTPACELASPCHATPVPALGPVGRALVLALAALLGAALSGRGRRP